MTEVSLVDKSDTEETPINVYLKNSYNQLLKLADENQDDGEDVDVEYIKKYHEKHFKVFK